MSDFFSPPPGFPDVPPEPSTPPPDFEQIGTNIWTGVTKAAGPGGWLNQLYDILVRVVTTTVGIFLSGLIYFFTFVVELIDKTLDVASGAFGSLVATTLKSLFGVDVSPASVSTRIGGPDRQQVAQKLGKTITNTLFSGATAIPGGGVVPSDVAANNYLAVVMNMELNGWIESWFTDGLSGHILEKYGDLKDGIARVLGLGRMSRQVFAAPIKILVHDPYTELLNSKYRPKQSSERLIVMAFLRSEIDADQLSAMLAVQGYSEQGVQWLVREHARYIPDADVDFLISRGAWQYQDGVDYLTQQGWLTTEANYLLQVLATKREEKYKTEQASVITAAYERGDVSEAQLTTAIQGLLLPQDEEALAITVAQSRRATHITHLSRGDIEQGILDGIMSFTDLQAWATRVNMPAAEVIFLELMIQFKMNRQTDTAKAKAAAAKAKAAAAQAKATATAQKAAQAKALAADKGVTVGQAETLVEDGLWTFQQLTAFLTAKGYGGDAIDAIVALLHAKMAKTAAGTTTKTAVSAALGAKGLSLAETEKAVVAGILSIEDLQNFLTGHGFDAADSKVIVDLTQDAITAAQVKAAAKTAAAAKAADKQLSLAEIEKAVRLGLTTIDTYNAALKAADFDPMAITLLDGILNDQIAADKAAAAKKAATSGSATGGGVTMAQLEQEVINGIRPIADYSAELVKLGYSPGDQMQLTELLQLKVDQAKVTAVKRTAAAAALQARGISLTQAETAVKLGVAPISTYTQMLTAAHFTPDAIDVLTNSLLAEVAKERKAQTAANAAAGALATKAISLPSLERAVIAGIDPISDYTNTLTAAGYSAADASTLTQLLQLKVDQAKTAIARHADAEGLATQKGISLGKEEAAVVAGDKTMDDYDALLTALGYDSIDRATLESLLQTKVTAAAAKAGTTAPASDSGTTPVTPGS